MDLDPTINTGVILQDPQGTDYIAGVNSPIPYEELNPSGDWSDYLPSDELQVGLYFDTMACVSFSACNALETQLNYRLAKGLITAENASWLHDKGYLDANGKVNFSDRYIAKLSGTTPQGNTMQKVADTIRHFGLVPESVWPAPLRQQNPPFTWDNYYSEIPDSVKQIGQEFLTRFDIAYEFVSSDQSKHQKQSPLQIILCTCPGWGKPPVASCPNQPNHAVMQVNNSKVIYDHYDPYKKQLASDYKIYYWMKYVATEKQSMEFYQVQGESTVVKKEGGKYFEIATDPQFYPYIKALLGIPDSLNPIGRDVVNANLGGQLVVGITYVKK